jgi:DnaK suppressor protein
MGRFDWEPSGPEARVDIERYRQRLVGLEQQLAGRIGREVETARSASEEPGDVGDRSVAEELKDESLKGAENNSAVLAEVRAALRRLDDGTYGQCAVDGGPIEPQRLDAVPWTPYCVSHQHALEAAGPALRMPTL